jgi:Flp pilus assembly protein CpaB
VLSTVVVAVLVVAFALLAGAAGWLVWRLWSATAVPSAAGAPVPDPAEER